MRPGAPLLSEFDRILDRWDGERRGAEQSAGGILRSHQHKFAGMMQFRSLPLSMALETGPGAVPFRSPSRSVYQDLLAAWVADFSERFGGGE